jgi:hypothetical protein
MDDPVVELLDSSGLQKDRFRLGTPDLAAASKFVADEHQHRTPCGGRDARKGRSGGQSQGTGRQVASVQHGREYALSAAASEGGFTVL